MADTVRVKAVGNVLGLTTGDIAEFPINYPELADCLRLGTLVQVDENNNPIETTIEMPKRRCCGGR